MLLWLPGLFPAAVLAQAAATASPSAVEPVGVDAAAPAAPAWVPTDPAKGQWSFNFSPYSFHYSPSDEHELSVAVGLRRQHDGPGFFGAAFFTNSFGQPSVYGYYGHRYYGGIPSQPTVFVEWSLGLVYGYVGEHTDDVPMNVRGVSPVILLSPGLHLTPKTSVQLNIAGTAAVMVQFDFRLD